MNRKSGFVTILAAGMCLLAVAGAQAPSLKDSIAQYEQDAAKARSGHKTRELLLYLNLLASVYRESGQLQKALDCLNEARVVRVVVKRLAQLLDGTVQAVFEINEGVTRP